jgi:CBS domain containing-hemolysin-like protein
LPKGSWDTIGGLLLDLAGGVPEVGEFGDVKGFRLVAEKIDGRRIDRVRIEPRTNDEQEEA